MPAETNAFLAPRTLSPLRALPLRCLALLLHGLAWLITPAVPLPAQSLEKASTAELYRYISQFEQEGDYAKAGEAYRQIADRDRAKFESLDRAIRNYLEAQKMYARAGDSVNMIQVMSRIGRLYCVTEYYPEATALFERILSFARKHRDTLMQAQVTQQIGDIHIARGNFNDAARYFLLAIPLHLATRDTLLSSVNRFAVAALQPKKNVFRSLPDSCDLRLTRFDSIRYRSWLPSIRLHTGLYNLEKGRYALARRDFHEGLRLAGQDPFLRRMLYQYQADCHEQAKDTAQALFAIKALVQFNDSLHKVIRSANIQQGMLRQRDVQQQTEFQDMARDRNISILKSRIQRVISYALLAGIIIMLIGSYIIIRSYQQRLSANQIITSQNEEINQRKIRELESNLKIETMNSMLRGQEAERERIARDLHDSLGGLLSTVKLHFDALQAVDPDIARQAEYTKAYGLLDDACNEVRTISNNMQPGALLKMGLIPAIRDLINRIESKDTPKIEFLQFGPLHALPTGIILHIYRIVQELLYNSIRHSAADEIMIQLIRHPEDLEIMVEDNGRGYDPAKARRGMGTENVAARVNYLKGEISIHSEPRVGTTTTITIPLPETDPPGMSRDALDADLSAMPEDT